MEEWNLLQIIKHIVTTFAIGIVHFRVLDKLYVVGFNAILPVGVFLTCHYCVKLLQFFSYCKSHQNIL